MTQPQFIVISGLSGSGKSTVVKAFEDQGAYCVDNLPTALLPRMVDLAGESTMDLRLVVLGMDMREKHFRRDFPATFLEIRRRGVPIRLFFLTSSEKVLVRRYSETRRVHPLGGATLLDSIRREMGELESLGELADRIIDTSETSIRELREEVLKVCREVQSPGRLSVTVLTFGYKHGLPFNTDLVFDVRFLPNPFFVLDLKHRTGLDEPVRAFVMEKPETKAFLEEYLRFLAFLLPRYQEEGRAYLTVGIGCTGGRHRSVVIAGKTAELVQGLGYPVSIRHRDIEA